MLPVIWTAESPEQALADYATVPVFDQVRAEARVRQIDGSARAREQLALSHGSVISPTAITQLAAVKKSTVGTAKALFRRYAYCRGFSANR